MDRANEQLQDDSRKTSNDGLNLQLDLLTEEEQKQSIAEAENASVFLVTQEIIDEDLQLGSGFQNGKFRIYQQFIKGLSNKENAEFLKQEYGTGGRSTSINNIFQNHDSKGITFEDLKSDRKYTLNWNKVAKRIGELIAQDRYFSELEKDEYLEWLDANEIEQDTSKEITKDKDFELAKMIYDFIKDYDFYSYITNYSLDNIEEQNIQLIIADINDESNVKEYITFLKSTLEDVDYDDEFAVETRELIVQLENKLPNYEFKNGDIVYIGIEQYEIRTIDDEKVTLIDTSFPLLSKEMQREEFEKKVKENPANDKLRTGKKVEDEQKSVVKKETQDNIKQGDTKETHDKTKPLLERLHTFFNEYDIYDVNEVTLDEVKEILSDKQKILDTVNYFYELLESEDILDEFSNELNEFIKELSNLYEEKDKIVSEYKTSERFDDFLSRIFNICQIDNYDIIKNTDRKITDIKIDGNFYIVSEALKYLIDKFDTQQYDGIENDIKRISNELYKYREENKKDILEKEITIENEIYIAKEIAEYETQEDIVVLENKKDKTYKTETIEYIKFLLKDSIEKIDEKDVKEEKIKINVKKKRRNKIEYFDLHPEIALKDRNNYAIFNKDLGVGTPKEKFRKNIEAIKVLKKCNEENRYATPEEQEKLSEYVGWGGLADAFDPNKNNWSDEYKELKEILTEKEYNEARESTLTAFYTPPIVISSIYKALENMGLERGNLLEPSCRYRKLYGNATRKIKRMQNVWN